MRERGKMFSRDLNCGKNLKEQVLGKGERNQREEPITPVKNTAIAASFLVFTLLQPYFTILTFKGF